MTQEEQIRLYRLMEKLNWFFHQEIYHQDHTFEVWQVEIDGQIHRFAAGEFSNCVWGFYLEKDG